MLPCCFFSQFSHQSNVCISPSLGGSLNKEKIDHIFTKYEDRSITLVRAEGQASDGFIPSATNLSDLYFLEIDHISNVVDQLFKDILNVVYTPSFLGDKVQKGKILEDVFTNLHTLCRDTYRLNEMEERYEAVIIFPDDIKRNKWRSRCIEEIANHNAFLDFIIDYAVHSPANSISKETCEILSSLKGTNIEYYGGLINSFSRSKFSVRLVTVLADQGETDLNSVAIRLIDSPRWCNIFNKTKTRNMLENKWATLKKSD